jgi:FtsZ-binding cell division protein ZapB
MTGQPDKVEPLTPAEIAEFRKQHVACELSKPEGFKNRVRWCIGCSLLATIASRDEAVKAAGSCGCNDKLMELIESLRSQLQTATQRGDRLRGEVEELQQLAEMRKKDHDFLDEAFRDVSANRESLRSEVARLTEERDAWKNKTVTVRPKAD